MKQFIIQSILRKAGISLISALLTLALFSSCETETPVAPVSNEGETLVTLSLAVPANTSVAATHLITGADEEAVITIGILMYKDGNYAYTARNEDSITSTANMQTVLYNI